MGDFGLESTKPTSDVLMGIRAGPKYDDKCYGASDGTVFNANALAAFANDYLAGKLTPHVRPDPPPPPPYDDEAGDTGDYSDDEDYGAAGDDDAEQQEDKDEV